MCYADLAAAAAAGCVLELEGCCYLANAPLLLQHLSRLAADKASWPVVVGFSGSEPQQLQAEGTEELQQQIQQLHDLVAAGLGHAGQYACSTTQYACSMAANTQQSSDSNALAGAAGAGAPAAAASTNAEGLSATSGGHNQPGPAAAAAGGSQPWLPTIKLDSCPGLPAMPTLNGFLLCYPVVYYVRDLREAGAASRMLSASVLQLHRVSVRCGKELHGCLQSFQADDRKGSKASYQSADSIMLMSFTVPDGAAAEAGDAVGCMLGNTSNRLQGSVCVMHEVWDSVEHTVTNVGPQAVSL